jgi:peptidase MA superfamily protein
MGGLRVSVVRRRARMAVIVAAALLGLVTAAGPARAATPAFGAPRVEGSFGQSITATQPVVLDAIPDRVEVLIATADDPAPLVREVDPPASGSVTLTYVLPAADGHIAPNTPIRIRWRITTGGATTLGPEARMTLVDQRFDWRTAAGDLVRVHWYEGDDAFGQRALRIGERAVRDTAALLGVTETDPIDFFIYADQGPFYDALGPGTRENVGGQANTDIRTLFALIPPSSIDAAWVENVVPHELVHLVFDTAVANPYHFPPRWLNEGLAVYLSVGDGPDDRAAVEQAVSDGTLIPLDGLIGEFPTSAGGFGLGYSESVGAVDFLIRTHGQDAMVALIRSYHLGRTDDEAFSAAIGQTTAQFNDAWLASLGAAPPTRRGPQPAPAGPKPEAWGGTAPTDHADQTPRRVIIAVVGGIVFVAAIGLVVERSRRERRSRGGSGQ